MHLLASSAIFGVVSIASICAAQAAAYGNPSGCAAFREDWDNVSDLMILITSEEAVRWERSCPLVSPKFDGAEMQVVCSGEGEKWPLVITLYIDPKRPDVMVYSEDDPASPGDAEFTELSLCK